MPHPKSRKNQLRIAHTKEDGLAIYDETSDHGHLLNLTAATVYKLADGTRSIDTLAEQVAARTGLPADQDVVLLALDELDQAGLLETDDTVVPHATIHRRRFLAKVGLVAGAAALVPLVSTITRVSQIAAQSDLRQATSEEPPPPRDDGGTTEGPFV